MLWSASLIIQNLSISSSIDICPDNQRGLFAIQKFHMRHRVPIKTWDSPSIARAHQNLCAVCPRVLFLKELWKFSRRTKMTSNRFAPLRTLNYTRLRQQSIAFDFHRRKPFNLYARGSPLLCEIAKLLSLALVFWTQCFLKPTKNPFMVESAYQRGPGKLYQTIYNRCTSTS